MAGPSSISSAVSHDPEANDLKTLFARGLDIQTADNDKLNKFVIHRFTQYAATNIEDYSLWDSVQMDFAEFEAKQLDKLDTDTWKVVKDYCYPHGFWIDHNFGPGRTPTTVMLKAIDSEWNNKWTLEQISWVEDRYSTLSIITRKRKQEHTGIPNLDCPGHLEPNTANSRGLSVEPQIQQFQDNRFQTPPQQTPQDQGQSLPQQQPFISQDVRNQHDYHNQSDPRSQQYYHRRLQNQYRRNDHQPAPTPVFNPVPYRPTSKIRDDHKCIPKRSTAPILLTQALPIQAPQRLVPRIQAPSILAPSTQAPPVQAPPIQVPPAQELPAQALPVSAASKSNKPGYGQSKKQSEQVNIVSQSDICFSIDNVDALTDGNMEIAGLLEKDVFKGRHPRGICHP